MTSYGYIIMIIADSCMIWFHFDRIMQMKKQCYIATMFVAKKVILLLMISLTAQRNFQYRHFIHQNAFENVSHFIQASLC